MRTIDLADTQEPRRRLAVPFFLTSPGQVGYSADGRFVVVTTKANNTILTFRVGDDGRLAPNPVVNAPTGAVPVAFESTRSGDLAVVEAGSSSVTTYHVNRDGTLTSLSSVVEGKKAPCWITRVGDRFYLGNTGSANLSAIRIDAAGQGSLVGPDRDRDHHRRRTHRHRRRRQRTPPVVAAGRRPRRRDLPRQRRRHPDLRRIGDRPTRHGRHRRSERRSDRTAAGLVPGGRPAGVGRDGGRSSRTRSCNSLLRMRRRRGDQASGWPTGTSGNHAGRGASASRSRRWASRRRPPVAVAR